MQEEIQKKADEIGKRLNCKVLPIVFKDEESGEDIIGFMREPNRMMKLRVLDKAMTSPVTAASELFDAVLIKEESDARFSSEKSEDDKYYLGGTMAVYSTVQMSVNTFKKK